MRREKLQQIQDGEKTKRQSTEESSVVTEIQPSNAQCAMLGNGGSVVQNIAPDDKAQDKKELQEMTQIGSNAATILKNVGLKNITIAPIPQKNCHGDVTDGRLTRRIVAIFVGDVDAYQDSSTRTVRVHRERDGNVSPGDESHDDAEDPQVPDGDPADGDGAGRRWARRAGQHGGGWPASITKPHLRGRVAPLPRAHAAVLLT